MNNKTIYKWFSMLLLMVVAGLPSATAQSLAIADFNIKAGETKAVAVTLATGENTVYGIQTDIVLSQGLTLEAAASVDESLTFAQNTVKSGAERIAQLSLAGSAIPAGDVITLTVKAADSFTEGTVTLTNTRLTTTTTGTELKVADVTANVTLEVEPVVIEKMYLVGDFTGGWPDGDDWTMAKEMTQDPENPVLWTYTLEAFEVTAKKYEYKVSAHQAWDNYYQLPKEGNQDFVFGTEGYPAGKYNIVITADTEKHELSLTAEAVGPEPVEPFDYEKIAIDPVDHSTVESLQNFTLTFGGQEVTVNAEVKPTLAGQEGTIALNEDGSVSITFAEAITAGGSCTLEIPGGAILYNGVAIDPLSFYYTIVGPLSFTIDPVSGIVESLSTFTVTFSDMVALGDNAKAYLFNAETEEEISASIELIGGDKKLFVSLDNEVTTPGEWQLNIEGVTDMDETPIELIFDYTIKDAAVVDQNYYILGDFWGWDNPKQMEESNGLYTLVIDATVEAKNYEYKLRQGDNWDGYQLPAAGNDNYKYTFEEAGDYTLTFTANVTGEEINGIAAYTVVLDVEKKAAPVETSITLASAADYVEGKYFVIEAANKVNATITITPKAVAAGARKATAPAALTGEMKEGIAKIAIVGDAFTSGEFTISADKEVEFTKVTLTASEEATEGKVIYGDNALDAAKKELQDAITKATTLNVIAKDADLAAAISTATTAMAGDDLAAIIAAGQALKAAALTAAKTTLQKAVTLAKTFGVAAEATASAEALLANAEATADQLQTALMAMYTNALPDAKEALKEAKSFFATFDSGAAAALAEEFSAVETALNGFDMDAMLTAVKALAAKALPYAKTDMGKIIEYVSLINDEKLNADISLAQAELEKENVSVMTLVSIAKTMQTDFMAAVPTYIATVTAMAQQGEAEGKNGVAELKAAVAAAQSALTASDATLVTVGKAIYALIKAVEAYNEANIPVYTATFTTNAEWAKVYAYTWTGEGESKVEQLKGWPGTQLDAVEGVYTVTIKSETAPAYIIFNNGNGGEGNQTKDLVFKNGEAYEYTVEKPIIPAGKYYVQNTAYDNPKMLMAGGHSWGTKGIVNEKGLDFDLIYNDVDKTYTFDSRVYNGGNSHFLSNELWVDSDKGFAWTIDGDSDNGYTISGIFDGVKKYIAVDSNFELVLTEDGSEVSTKWLFLNKDFWENEVKANGLEAMKTATAENGVDATFLIKCPDFNRNDSRNDEAWTMEAGDKNLKGGGRNGNGCAESYHSTFTLSQKLEDAPAGVYTLTAQGFYRQDGSDEYNKPYFYANEERGYFPVMETLPDHDESSNNSMGDAGVEFSNGKYTIDPITVKVANDGELTVGAKLETNNMLWCIWDNFKLTYFGPIPADEMKGVYEEALAAARAALENTDYAAVTGEEKTALVKAIEDNTEVENTTEAYKDAIKALEDATTAFKDAKAAYEGLVAAQAAMAGFDFAAYPYASEAKKTAAQDALTATAVNAADATEKTAAVNKALRQYAESSALLEGVEDAVSFTDRIVNPNAEDGTNGWTVTGKANIKSNESFTDGDGKNNYKYFDSEQWSDSSWDISLKQTVKLPAGKYYLTVSSRASANVDFTLIAGENTKEMQTIGNGGGLFNRGWNDNSIEFEVAKAGSVEIGVRGVTSVVHEWMSFTRFRLMKFEAYEPVYTVAGGVDTEEGGVSDPVFTLSWDPTFVGNEMDKGEDDIYTLSLDDAVLTPGSTILYKVVADHEWDYLSWGFNGGNADYVVKLPEGKTLPVNMEKGYFDITFKFNPVAVFANGFNVDCDVVYDEEKTEQVSTGIANIDAEAVKNGNVYNLNGQRVMKAQKGLYIINGKKQVVK